MLSFSAISQQELAWDFSYNKSTKRIECKATLDKGWHIYSMNLNGISGPIETEFEFENNNLIELIGGISEPEPKVEFDPNFEETVRYFEKEVIFSQEIKIKKNTVLKGSVVYMICNATMCLPPVEKKFEISLKK